MATRDGGSIEGLFPAPSGTKAHVVSLPGSGIGLGPSTGVTITYVMRGRDVDCGSLTYRTWSVLSAPDYTGASYVGARCGVTPLADVVVVGVRRT